jgi:hypothetical protein
MTGKRTKSASERKTRKLKVKKETLKDLGVEGARGVKGGTLFATGACRFGGQTLGIGCGGGAQTGVGLTKTVK